MSLRESLLRVSRLSVRRPGHESWLIHRTLPRSPTWNSFHERHRKTRIGSPAKYIRRSFTQNSAQGWPGRRRDLKSLLAIVSGVVLCTGGMVYWITKSDGRDVTQCVVQNTLLKTNLIRQDGSSVPGETLKDHIVALYFSAHWCPPCRNFTPYLKHAYEELKAMNADFEVVFVSSDTSSAASKRYFEEAHGDWLMVHFDDPTRKALQLAFGVWAGPKENVEYEGFPKRSGIPTLMIVRLDGTVISPSGRRELVIHGPQQAFEIWKGSIAE